jgi:molecular chaperone GrpE
MTDDMHETANDATTPRDDLRGPETESGAAASTDTGSGVEASQAAALEAQLAEQQDKYLRLLADFDNFRKRAVREREAASHHGQGVVIKGLLEGMDDLARCAALDAASVDAATVLDGVRLVEQKLLKSLAGHGLERVDPAGRPFDPALHEALTTAPAASAEDDDLVSHVYQVGYVFNGQLLRPARVVVSQWTA